MTGAGPQITALHSFQRPSLGRPGRGMAAGTWASKDIVLWKHGRLEEPVRRRGRRRLIHPWLGAIYICWWTAFSHPGMGLRAEPSAGPRLAQDLGDG